MMILNNISEEATEISTENTETASSPVSPASDLDNIKYINFNFVENSETSSETTKDYGISEGSDISHVEQDNKTSGLSIDNSCTVASQVCDSYIARGAENSEDLKISGKLLPKNKQYKPNSHEKKLVKYDEPGVKIITLHEMGFRSFEIFTWDNIMQPQKECLLKLLQFMISNHIKPNVQITISHLLYNCHLMVLQAYSEFFMECNNEFVIDLPPNKVTPLAFKQIYDWMLTDAPIVHREGILEIFMAANYLRIKELINQCWLCLDDDQRFREDSAFLLYLEARAFGLENLEQLMLSRVCRFFLTLVASEEFLELQCYELCQLLASNTISVNSEVEVFMAAARWLDYNWEHRQKYLLEISSHIRYSLMPPWFLVTFNKKTGCPEVDRIIDHPDIRKMINDGISYSTTQLYYNSTHQEFVHFLDRYQLTTPLHRQWVYDRRCKYHHRSDCTNMQHLTYDIFLDYLDTVRQTGKDYWSTLEIAKTIPSNFKCCEKYGENRCRMVPNFSWNPSSLTTYHKFVNQTVSSEEIDEKYPKIPMSKIEFNLKSANILPKIPTKTSSKKSEISDKTSIETYITSPNNYCELKKCANNISKIKIGSVKKKEEEAVVKANEQLHYLYNKQDDQKYQQYDSRNSQLVLRIQLRAKIDKLEKIKLQQKKFDKKQETLLIFERKFQKMLKKQQQLQNQEYKMEIEAQLYAEYLKLFKEFQSFKVKVLNEKYKLQQSYEEESLPNESSSNPTKLEYLSKYQRPLKENEFEIEYILEKDVHDQLKCLHNELVYHYEILKGQQNNLHESQIALYLKLHFQIENIKKIVLQRKNLKQKDNYILMNLERQTQPKHKIAKLFRKENQIKVKKECQLFQQFLNQQKRQKREVYKEKPMQYEEQQTCKWQSLHGKQLPLTSSYIELLQKLSKTIPNKSETMKENQINYGQSKVAPNQTFLEIMRNIQLQHVHNCPKRRTNLRTIPYQNITQEIHKKFGDDQEQSINNEVQLKTLTEANITKIPTNISQTTTITTVKKTTIVTPDATDVPASITSYLLEKKSNKRQNNITHSSSDQGITLMKIKDDGRRKGRCFRKLEVVKISKIGRFGNKLDWGIREFHKLILADNEQKHQPIHYKIMIIGGVDPFCSHCMHNELSSTFTRSKCQYSFAENHFKIEHQLKSELSYQNKSKHLRKHINIRQVDYLDNYGDHLLYYDAPTFNWKLVSHIPFGSRYNHRTVVCNGMIYIIGGTRTTVECSQKFIFEKSVWCFKPKTTKWTLECSLPEGLRNFAAISIDDSTKRCKCKKRLGNGFFIIGGENQQFKALNTVYFYDIERKSWHKRAAMNFPRYGFGAALITNEIWIGGGIAEEEQSDNKQSDCSTKKINFISNTMECYSLQCKMDVNDQGICGGPYDYLGKWIQMRSRLSVPRMFLRFCVTSDKELFSVGGINFNSQGILESSNSVEYFNFINGNWQEYFELLEPRHGHDIVLLNDRLIIVGGVSTKIKRTLNTVESFFIKDRKRINDLPNLPYPISGTCIIKVDF